jgi:hypothetical protein
VVESEGEGEGSGGVCLGLLLFPSLPIEQDKQSRFARSLDSREGDPQQISFPPLGWLAKEGKRERDKNVQG